MNTKCFLILALIVGLTGLTATHGKEQWVRWVPSYSSQWDWDQYSANQVKGKPNVYPKYGDHVHAWSIKDKDANQYIELEFDQHKVHIEEIHIYETWHGGAVKRISARQETYNKPTTWVDLWTGTPTHVTSSRIFNPPLKIPSLATKIIKLYLDCTKSGSYPEIDAVKLIGKPAINCGPDPYYKCYDPNCDVDPPKYGKCYEECEQCKDYATRWKTKECSCYDECQTYCYKKCRGNCPTFHDGDCVYHCEEKCDEEVETGYKTGYYTDGSGQQQTAKYYYSNTNYDSVYGCYYEDFPFFDCSVEEIFIEYPEECEPHVEEHAGGLLYITWQDRHDN